MTNRQYEWQRKKIKLNKPWCELILGFDQAGAHVFYLSNYKDGSDEGKSV